MITPRCSPLRSFVSPVVAGLLLSASPLSAALVLQTANSASGTSWATGNLWDSNAGASAGNDYHTNGYTLRTPDGVNIHPVFDGDSLTVDGGAGGARGELTLKAGTSTIANLRIGVGTVRNAVAGSGSVNYPATLNVTNLTILSSATGDNAAIIRGNWQRNDITLNVTNLLGSGHLQFAKTTQNDNSKRLFTLSVTDASAFTGTLELAHGTLDLASAVYLTQGKFVMATTDTTLRLNSSLTVSSFTFGSNQLEIGTYTSADLNALFATNAFTGDGVLQVVVPQIPEPSSFALVLGGAMLTACAARRRARATAATR